MGITLSNWHVQEPRNTKSLKKEQVVLMPAGLECNFLNVSINPKHACAVAEIIGRIEKGAWVNAQMVAEPKGAQSRGKRGWAL